MGVKYLRFGGQSGLTVGAAIRSDVSGYIWNGTAMVEEVPASVLTYAATVPIPETGTGTGHYRALIATVAPNLPPDKYHINYHDLPSGDVIQQSIIEYDGSEIIDDLVVGASIADICNMALSHLGIGVEIANLETDMTAEGKACRRYYSTALQDTLRSAHWPFAKRVAALGLVQADPTEEWDYAYRYPTNALYVNRILSGTRTDSKDTATPYRIYGDDAGRLIYTDKVNAEIEYIANVTNPVRFPPDFVLAFSLRLALLVSPRLAGSNPKLRVEVAELYRDQIMNARASSANEEQPDLPPESEFISEVL
jgi:hypothetical protein